MVETNSNRGPSPNIITALPRNGFSQPRILVVGDLILDRYITGDVNRISPEAPVPVLTVRQERTVAGGAANVALNVAGLRGKAILAGVIGKDMAGERLLEILAARGVSNEGVVRDETRPTTCKTRVMCKNHQIVRIDNEVCDDVIQDVQARLTARVKAILDHGVDAVVISDYAKGVLTPETTSQLIATCKKRSIPVLVDPKRADYTVYCDATCITPNHKEFIAALALFRIPYGDVGVCGSQLRKRLGCGTLLVTQGALGMTVITSEHTYHFPALAEEVFDVSGAGDTVIATLTTCLASGLNLMSAVQVANIAASIVVKRAGTVPVDWETLYSAVELHAERAGGAGPTTTMLAG